MTNSTDQQAKLQRAIQQQDDLQKVKKYRKTKAAANPKPALVWLPNGTTFMAAPFNPVQLKVIVYILKELQPYIKSQLPHIKEYSDNKTTKNIHALNLVQGELFKQIDGNFYCKLPKKVFVTHRHYNEFKNDVDSLSNMRVSLKKRNPLTNKIEIYKTNLFSTYEPQGHNTKSRAITIEITKTVLDLLCRICVALGGESKWDVDYYNNLTWEVILRCKKQYSGLLYFYLCAWRKQGGWKIPTVQLKEMLGLDPEQYARNWNFKSRILKPSTEELKKLGIDFWFEADFEGDYTVFKIINPERLQKQNEHVQHLIKQLSGIHMKEDDIRSIFPILSETDHYNKINSLIQDCTIRFLDKKNTNEPIRDLPKYILATIKGWHKNLSKGKNKTNKGQMDIQPSNTANV